MDTQTIITAVIALIGGGIGTKVIDYFANRRKSNVDLVGAETDALAKLTKLVEDALNEGRRKDAELAKKVQEIQRLEMTNEVLNGTINKNNEFMKEVLIGWGEMKKSEEICQQRVASMEVRLSSLENAV